MQKRFGQKAQIACFGGRRGQYQIQSYRPHEAESQAQPHQLRMESAGENGAFPALRSLRSGRLKLPAPRIMLCHLCYKTAGVDNDDTAA